jgi:2-polyprenyl-3-methyl-5-hydroxy-6-metoxy-1,4-benzoquinol methylase
MTKSANRPASAVEFHDVIAGAFARRYEESPRFAERLAVFRATLERYLSKDSVMLDLGCGPGHLAMLAATLARRAIGIDGSAEMVRHASRVSEERGVKNVEFRQEMLEEFDGAEAGPVDVVVLSSVLEYVALPDRLLGQCRNALRSEGVLILSVPNGDSWYRVLEQATFGLLGRPRYLEYARVERRSRQVKRLQAAGFIVREISPFAPAPGLSFVFRLTGAARFSDTLLLIVAQRMD